MLCLIVQLNTKRAFGCLAIQDRNYVHCPSDDEWNRAARMCEFLKPFFVMTNLISGSTYPTSIRYFMQVWKIEKLLCEFVMCEDLVVKEMASKMMTKFSKYWHDYCVILSIGAILDPRMKFGAIQFAYRKIEPSTSEEEYVDYLSQNATTNGKYELDLYLEEGNLDPKFYEKLDVLAYQRDRHDHYSNLSWMACDGLSISITTVVSESTFSLGSRVLTKYRSTILPKNVELLILTQNWLHGLKELGNFYNEKFLIDFYNSSS
uniref:AC transposase n=1 Tax=Cajanus cajan TaxID=3821 RepID=A0A151QZK2_CAJCA|nr:Putative AC transposase [Cajanus cajan]